MKWIFSVTTVAALCVSVIFPGQVSGAGSDSQVLVRYHFAGTGQWSDAGEGATLREIIRLPQSKVLGQHLLGRAARAPGVLFGERIDAAQAAGGVPLLQPLLADVLEHESFLELSGQAGGVTWLFGIALPTDRAVVWQRNLVELQALWKLGTAESSEQNRSAVTTVRRGSGGTVLRWGQAGGWLLLGVGPESMTGWDATFLELNQAQRPRPGLAESLLDAEIDVSKLAGGLGLPLNEPWPRVLVKVSGREQDLRVDGRLIFDVPVTGSLDPWRVPTNLIREPLISFGAWRGTRPLLERWETLSKLGIKPAPNEVYTWAQSLNVPQSLVAFPANDATHRAKAMLEPARKLIPAAWQERGLGQLEWQEQESQLVWRGLPLLFPHLRGVEDGGQGYLIGGSFPALLTTNAPPQELLDQLAGKANLVHYHWEMTARRLPQLRMQILLASMVSGKSVLPSKSPVVPWLDEMEKRLGNSATELSAISPKEWALTRKSAIGLTAAELVGLLCWVESLDFPKLSWRFPEQTRSKGPPGPPGPKKK